MDGISLLKTLRKGGVQAPPFLMSIIDLCCAESLLKKSELFIEGSERLVNHDMNTNKLEHQKQTYIPTNVSNPNLFLLILLIISSSY